MTMAPTDRAGRNAALDKRALLAWTAAVLLGIVAFIGLQTGLSTEAGVRELLRATARLSALLFMVTFAASGLRRLFKRPATAWLMRNRRYVGLSFALSHAVHLVAIIVLARGWPASFDATTSDATRYGGGFAFVMIALLVATSWDGAVKRLGSKTWRRLHTVGSYVVFGVFAVTYLPAAIAGKPWSVALALVVVGGAAARWAGKRGL